MGKQCKAEKQLIRKDQRNVATGQILKALSLSCQNGSWTKAGFMGTSFFFFLLFFSFFFFFSKGGYFRHNWQVMASSGKRLVSVSVLTDQTIPFRTTSPYPKKNKKKKKERDPPCFSHRRDGNGHLYPKIDSPNAEHHGDNHKRRRTTFFTNRQTVTNCCC